MEENNSLTFLLILFIGLGLGLGIYYFSTPSFEDFDRDKMLKHLVAYQKLAIRKAQSEGVYHCCIDPPCTMCFMEENSWNHYTPGTCDCAEFTARGKKPCPQCIKGMNKTESPTCNVSTECD